MIFNKDFICRLLDSASSSERLRQNYDLRNSATDTSQRMMNALQPDTQVPIHRHTDTAETVICIFGRLEEIFYESTNIDNTEFKEISRFMLCPSEGNYGMQIPAGTWHSINVIEPSVIFEAKDGAYKG
jgi:cupin fold WbuC family metalloprotein